MSEKTTFTDNASPNRKIFLYLEPWRCIVDCEQKQNALSCEPIDLLKFQKSIFVMEYYEFAWQTGAI